MTDRPDPTRRRPAPLFRRGGGGFTLIEILIVVVILGILAAVVVPQFSNASMQARQTTLLDELRYVRTQIEVYAAQHRDVPPGYPDGDVTAAPTAEAFREQLLGPTDEYGRPKAAVGPGTFGLYLTRMPENPVSGLSTVRVVPGEAVPEPDRETGWFYLPLTRQFVANLDGTDLNGKPYIDY